MYQTDPVTPQVNSPRHQRVGKCRCRERESEGLHYNTENYKVSITQVFTGEPVTCTVRIELDLYLHAPLNKSTLNSDL